MVAVEEEVELVERLGHGALDGVSEMGVRGDAQRTFLMGESSLRTSIHTRWPAASIREDRFTHTWQIAPHKATNWDCCGAIVCQRSLKEALHQENDQHH